MLAHHHAVFCAGHVHARDHATGDESKPIGAICGQAGVVGMARGKPVVVHGRISGCGWRVEALGMHDRLTGSGSGFGWDLIGISTSDIPSRRADRTCYTFSQSKASPVRTYGIAECQAVWWRRSDIFGRSPPCLAGQKEQAVLATAGHGQRRRAKS